MGYRSNVYFHMSKAGYDFFKEQIADMWIEPDFEEVHDEYVYFGINGIKWYAKYEDVKAYMFAFVEMDEAGYVYSFIRLGEDNDDSERLSNFWYGCEFKNDIERNVPELYITRDVSWD